MMKSTSKKHQGRFVVSGFMVWNTLHVRSHSSSCFSLSEGDELAAPTDLVTSEVTHRSFRATWTAPDGPVDKYRVTYVAVAGGPTQEVRSSFFPVFANPDHSLFEPSVAELNDRLQIKMAHAWSGVCDLAGWAVVLTFFDSEADGHGYCRLKKKKWLLRPITGTSTESQQQIRKWREQTKL